MQRLPNNFGLVGLPGGLRPPSTGGTPSMYNVGAMRMPQHLAMQMVPGFAMQPHQHPGMAQAMMAQFPNMQGGSMNMLGIPPLLHSPVRVPDASFGFGAVSRPHDFQHPGGAVVSLGPHGSHHTSSPQDRSSLTVYVGHIAVDAPDDIVKQLLMECGRVLKWTRTQDPATQRLSPFGFCEFDSGQGVWRATKFLNGVKLDNQILVVTCQDKAKECLEQWQEERTKKAQAANPSLTPQDVLRQLETEEENVKKSILKLLSDGHLRMERDRARQKLLSSQQAAAAAGADSAGKKDEPSGEEEDADGTESEIHPSTPVPVPNEVDGVTEPKDGANMASTVREPAKPSEAATNSNIAKTKNWRPSTSGDQNASADLTASSGPSSKASGLTNDYRVNYREKDRELRISQRQKERDREFARRERDWMRTETSFIKERHKRRDHEASKLSVSSHELVRLIESDLFGDNWEGHKPKRRREEEKRRLREKEKINDEIDRNEEFEEMKTRQANGETEAAKGDTLYRAGEAEEGEIDPSLSTSRLTSRTDSDVVEITGRSELKGGDAESGGTWMPNESSAINSSMDSSVIVDGESSVVNNRTKTTGEVKGFLGSTRIQLRTSQSRRIGKNAMQTSTAFGSGGEEEDTLFPGKHKALTKLDSLQDPKNLEQQTDELRKQKDAIHKIAQNVPSDKVAVFKYEIDFDLLEEGGVFEAKLKPWVAKRVAEMLGKEEQELVDYILDRMSQKPTASEMLEELEEMIDTEADGFVIRMWRVIIFEQLRLKKLGQH